jgi:pimeloyl-ACP methyl ester carboxylesterase
MQAPRLVVDSKSACSVERVSSATPNTLVVRLMTAEGYLYPPHCHRQALEYVLSKRDGATGVYRPFVLFIHGRGKNPSHAYVNRLLESIESQHGVTVVMMTWPSWNGFAKLADDQARQSADELLQILELLADLKKEQGSERHYALLTHSTGSLVVEELVNRYPDRQPRQLFDALVLSSSVSLVGTHTQWFDRQALARRVWSVSNRRDFALRCLESDLHSFGICDDNSEPVLGRLSGFVDSESLSSNAVYIDLSDVLKRKHRYYVYKNDIDPAIHVSSLFSAMLRGEALPREGLDEVIPGRLYSYSDKD